MATPARKSPSKIAARKALLRLTQKRLERFVTLFLKLLVSGDPELIHDLRVASRRLQQTFTVMLSKPKPRGARKIVKVLRDVRQSLGSCRNLDVNLTLARQRAQEAQAPAARDAWNALARHLSGERGAMLEDARQRIGRHDVASFIGRVRAVLDETDESADPLAGMQQSLRDSLAEWDEAYALAEKTRQTEELHSLRIAGKRLRYRAELLADAEFDSVKPMTKDLKQMQGILGDWHDLSMLARFMAEFVRRPNFVEKHPNLAGALLSQMEEEQKRAAELIDRFFADAPQMRKGWRQIGKRRSRSRKARLASTDSEDPR